MAAVDQRLGVVRRGATPAAPKPINLPSQKFENHRLVPDVEIVPRGTCCWGSAGRSIPASGSSNDKTDSASPPLGSNGTEDHGSKVQYDSVLTDEVQNPAEKSDQAYSVESSPSPASSTACITSAEMCTACPNLGVGNISAKEGSDSPAASDAGSFAEIVARPSSSESYSSSSATPTARVEEQKHFSRFSQVCSGDNEKVSNAQAKQETHAGNESSLGSQDFGYFEGLYNTQSSFSRPGVPYPNGPGMAFGPEMHPEPFHHYSFLGVPYYDSVKDKEIVVITMVGNPGVYGSYLPYPGFPSQFGRPSVYGNSPLQFGHFEHCVGPQVPAEMNPMCSGEDSGYVCYEQENYKQDWVNGSPVGNGQRNNGAHFPTQLYPMSDDCNMPRRTGRQKAVNRNRRPTREASPTRERRVTLLTKVSQHEVIISNMQRKIKHGGARRAKNTFGPQVFPVDVIEVAQNSTGIPVCASQPDEAILQEASNSDRVQVRFGASHSAIGCTVLESTETATVGELVNVGKICASDPSENMSTHDLSSLQAACRGSTNDNSISEPRYKEDAKVAVSEPSLTSILIPLPMSTSNSTPIPASQVSYGKASHQGSPPTCSSEILCQVPDSSVETVNVSEDNTTLKPEVIYVSKVGEIWLDGPCNLTKFAASMEPAFESMNDNEILGASAAACLPNEHMEESARKLLDQKGNKKWRRKGSVDVTKLGHRVSSQKIQDFGVDKRGSCHERPSDNHRDVMHTAGSGSLPSSPRKVKPVSEGGLTLCYGTSAALSSCDESPASSKNGQVMVSLVDTEDQLCKDKSSKGAEAGSATTGGFECGLLVDSSMKTSSAAGGQSSVSRIGAGKMWRPKLGAAGGHNSATKDSAVKYGQVAADPNVLGLQVKENVSISDCIGLNHTLEVPCEDYGKDNHKKQLKVSVHCSNYVQDEGCNKLSNTASLVSKAPCDYYGGVRSDQQPSYDVDSFADVEGDGKNKLLQTVQKQQRSEDLYLSHGIETKFESSRHVKVEFNSKTNSSPRKINLGKQGNAWRVVGKQKPQQKLPLKSELEPEHNNSVVKSKESVNFVQGVSWKPKQSCTVNKESFNGVEDKASNLALQNEVTAEQKEQRDRRPFSMKNFSNDDNRKATQLQQSLSLSSADMEHGMVRENMSTVGIGHGESRFLSRTTHMKVGRRGEFLIAKKVDRKGWVVKTEPARSQV